MAYTRRKTSDDATWQRAWTADTVADLATISAILGSERPHHGDIAFVTADSNYYLWLDNGSWAQITGLNAGSTSQSIILGMDGIDGNDGFPIPGPAGPAGINGTNGINGVNGLTIPAVDGINGEDGFSIVGPTGPKGDTGATGPTGPQGQMLFVQDGIDGIDGFPVSGPGSNLSGAALLAAANIFTNTGSQTFSGPLDISAVASGQIKFPSTPNPSSNANTLDDYEEGTWTPTLNSMTVSGATTLSGSYVKIGRVVYVQCSVRAVGGLISSNGTSNIGGLPFTAISDATAGAADDSTLAPLAAVYASAVISGTAIYTPDFNTTHPVICSGVYLV